MDKEKNEKIAKVIESFALKHNAQTDMRIYFNGVAWSYDSDGKKTIIEDIKGSKYFEYANDDTVSVSTEGGLYSIINMHDCMGDFSHNTKLYDELDKSLRELGVYFELGNAWNFSIHNE